MAVLIGGFATPSGILRKFTTDVHHVLVSVITDLTPTTIAGGEGGIVEVRFFISENGGPVAALGSTTVIEDWKQEFEIGSPHQGADPGKLSTLPCFGIELDCNDYQQGRIEVTATAHTAAGTSFNVPGSVVWFNAKNGEIRPSTKQIHVRTNGNDVTGDGSDGNAVASIARACELAQNTPGGTSAAQRNAGGAEVLVHGPGFFNFAGSYQTSNPRFHTEDHWLTIRLLDAAVLIPTGTLVVYGNGAGSKVKFRFIGGYVRDGDMVFYLDDPNVEVWVWMEGVLEVGSEWVPVTKRWSCKSLGKTKPMVAFDGPGIAKGYRIATCSGMIGTVSGWTNNWNLLLDCFVEDFLAISFLSTQILATNDPIKAINCRANAQRRFKDVAGVVNTYIGGAATVSVDGGNFAGKMRIDVTGNVYFSKFGNPSTAFPSDLSTLTEIIGSTYWGVLISGMPNSAWNGVFNVLAAGINGSGRAYVILDNTISVGGAVTGSAYIQTYRKSSSGAYADTYENLVHPDVWQNVGDQTGTYVYRLSAYDWDDARGLALVNVLNGCAYVDICIMGNSSVYLMNSDLTGPMIDSVLAGITVNGHIQYGSGSAAGTSIVDIVAHSGMAAPASAKFISHCHYEIGSAPSGFSPSTGDWFATDPYAAPWSALPNVEDAGTGSNYWKRLAADRWNGFRGDSRGCTRSIGTHDWTFSGAASPIVVLGAMPSSLAVTRLTGNPLPGVLISAALPPALSFSSRLAGNPVIDPKVSGALPVATAVTPMAGVPVVTIEVRGDMPEDITVEPLAGTVVVGQGVTGAMAPPVTASAMGGIPALGGIVVAGAMPGALNVVRPTGTPHVDASAPTTPPPATSGGGRGRRNVSLAELGSLLAALGSGLASRRKRRAR